MKEILKVKELKKQFKDKEALKGVNFTLNEGEILGLLGPNGAGKSTTINIISTVLEKTSGEITYKGKQIDSSNNKFKRVLGVVPQEIAIYEEVPVIKNLEFFGGIYGLSSKEIKENSEKALKFVKLEDKKNDLPNTFSGGMKRRLNIACALVHDPDIIIMDEPTVGIDPQSRNFILESIKELSKHGKSIIYTTHYMEEVEAIANRVVIIDKGQVIKESTIAELKEEMENESKIIITLNEECDFSIDEFYKIEGVRGVSLKDSVLEITTIKNIDNLDKIINVIFGKNQKIKKITTEENSLEDVFLNITGRKLRD
ncbi:MAG: ABC transporter ATP-binding protein [Clostridium sp.]|nr:ABC transporter ATP-binding protein [Clostridium sp.]